MKSGQGPAHRNSNDILPNGVISMHHENATYVRVCYLRSLWSFWRTMSQMLYVIHFRRVKLWMHSITSLFLQYHLRCVLRKKRPELFENAVILRDNATAWQQTAKYVLRRMLWEVLTPSLFFWYHSMWRRSETANAWATILQTENTF